MLDDSSSAFMILAIVSVVAEKAGGNCPTHRQSGWNCYEEEIH